jgi:hypothetical protein
MAVAAPKLEDLLADAAKARAALAALPPEQILGAIGSVLRDGRAKALLDDLDPLFLALPSDHPLAAHIQGTIGALNGLPSLIENHLKSQA